MDNELNMVQNGQQQDQSSPFANDADSRSLTANGRQRRDLEGAGQHAGSIAFASEVVARRLGLTLLVVVSTFLFIAPPSLAEDGQHSRRPHDSTIG